MSATQLRRAPIAAARSTPMTVLLVRLALVALALSLSACASLSLAQRDRAMRIAVQARSSHLVCDRRDACAAPSPLHELAGEAFVRSTPEQPRHYTLILDKGTNALLARIDLIRSATTTIDLQTYIFDEDDAGLLVLEELVDAARRGVRVRVLMDQLAALENIRTLAALAGIHENFKLRLYNPMLYEAKISYPQYFLAAACCWRQLNQRMHNKLLLIDGAIGITGGRNYQNDYFDWDPQFNFRDRDLLVAGPVARDMLADFEMFWNDPRSIPPARLDDVGQYLLERGVPDWGPVEFVRPQRVADMRAAAADPAQIQDRLIDKVIPVGDVSYIADPPDKHHEDSGNNALASRTLRRLIESAQHEVLLQTPYLVLSDGAQQMFRELQKRPDPPRIVISTNSLASTDAFIAYALSYKYKRRYLRDFGFNIYEYKPFPMDAPIDYQATGAPLPDLVMPDEVAAGDDNIPHDSSADDSIPDGSIAPMTAVEHRALKDRFGRRSVLGRARYRNALSGEYNALRFSRPGANRPVPLERAGMRIGLHAKSMVIDGKIGVIGTHNFDPRSDHYNTESVVVIRDEDFAQALADSIRRDISPANSWVIAPRDKAPILWGLEYSLAKLSEYLPIFDLWPVSYAVSYQYVPGPQCPEPLPPDHPHFRECYRPVGAFPEVDLGFKGLSTRIFTAFGAGLAPIL